MNALEAVQSMIEGHNMESIDETTLLLAWLQLHGDSKHGGMHPDDYLLTDGPYCGWHAVLAYMVHGVSNIRDEVLYPSFFSLLREHSLENLAQWHADDEDDSFQTMILNLNTLFKDMTLESIPQILKHLTDLHHFHEGAPTDVLVHVEDAIDVFTWLETLDH